MSVSERIKALAVMLAALTGAGVFGTLVRVPMRNTSALGLSLICGLVGVVGRVDGRAATCGRAAAQLPVVR